MHGKARGLVDDEHAAVAVEDAGLQLLRGHAGLAHGRAAAGAMGMTAFGPIFRHPLPFCPPLGNTGTALEGDAAWPGMISISSPSARALAASRARGGRAPTVPRWASPRPCGSAAPACSGAACRRSCWST